MKRYTIKSATDYIGPTFEVVEDPNGSFVKWDDIGPLLAHVKEMAKYLPVRDADQAKLRKILEQMGER